MSFSPTLLSGRQRQKRKGVGRDHRIERSKQRKKTSLERESTFLEGFCHTRVCSLMYDKLSISGDEMRMKKMI